MSATPAPDVVISSSTEGTSTSRGSPPSLAEPTGLENSRGGDCEAHVRPAWRPAYHVARCARARRSIITLLVVSMGSLCSERGPKPEGPKPRPRGRALSAGFRRWCGWRALLERCNGDAESCVCCSRQGDLDAFSTEELAFLPEQVEPMLTTVGLTRAAALPSATPLVAHPLRLSAPAAAPAGH